MPYLFLCFGCLFFGTAIALLTVHTLQHYDVESVKVVANYRIETIDNITRALSSLGGMPFVLFFTSLWSVFLIWKKQYERLVFVVIGVFGGIALGWALKWFVSRTRPEAVYAMVQSYGPSFPSAHSLYAVILACLAMLVYRNHPRIGFIHLFVIIWWLSMGFSRVYLGVHFPSDVLAGWGIGFFWISILWLGLINTSFSKNSFNFEKL
ncbi:MAG: phosphatase PAP2 family protein [Acinetobacter sp.]